MTAATPINISATRSLDAVLCDLQAGLALSSEVCTPPTDITPEAPAALEHQSYKGVIRDNPSESALSKRASHWDIIELVATYLEPKDWSSFARTCRAHYSIAQPLLWVNATLKLSQAQLFLDGVYRKPVVTNWVAKLGEENLECSERCDMVAHLTFNFVDLGLEMAEVCESVVARIRRFCPAAVIEARVRADTEFTSFLLSQGKSGGAAGDVEGENPYQSPKL